MSYAQNSGWLWKAVTFKRFEIQTWDWSRLKENLKIFKIAWTKKILIIFSVFFVYKWRGASFFLIRVVNAEKQMVMYGRKGRQLASQTDWWTDGQCMQMEKLKNGTTDIAGYKVACTRLKMGFNPEKISFLVHRLTCIWVKQRRYDLKLRNVVVTF